MRVTDIINKKINKIELSKEEIDFLVNGYVEGKIPDYQMSAFLMAVVFNSMSSKELGFLTKAYIKSGEVLDLSKIKGIKVDKHSTGGVGDKTTIAIAPIVSSLGAPVAKMSGRGLGHTGGTIDKLETIPGYRIELTQQEFIDNVIKHGVAVVGQSKSLVPADKKTYALRDVTGTVNSIPLIAASIMSKKLATGANAILLDVKCGEGAFMKDLKSARELATTMINIGKELNVDVRAEITNMSSPIGKEIGNKNEVLEAIKTLKGEGPEDFNELVYSSCATMLDQAGIEKDHKKAYKLIDESIKSGKALNKFYEWISSQSGDIEALKNPLFWNPKYKFEVKSKTDGYMNIYDSLVFGNVAMKLGAGRLTKEDIIDNEAGITIIKKTNDNVKIGDVIFRLYSSNPIDLNLIKELEKGFEINKQKVENKVILDRLK
ncbi:thymidine phosphorylase [Mycoplasma elephantis]|uniref:thymidine phosphorylase n=1 Tax=Mycoplasma elephantis TaxID=114882 RepID=UPI000488557B|nr:thymidine phosphorylase [Mycoplasma elephantis]